MYNLHYLQMSGHLLQELSQAQGNWKLEIMRTMMNQSEKAAHCAIREKTHRL